MSSILYREAFLTLFPNSIVCAGRYGKNKIESSKMNTINNVSADKADKLNSFKDKYDIFFTPNGDYKNVLGEKETTKGRTKKNVIDYDGNIYCFIGDIDFKEKVWYEYGLTPTIVNETKNGYHMFFMLKNPVLYREYADRFARIQDMLVDLLNIDPRAKDITRLLRVPGYKYFADNEGEFEIENIEFNPDEAYSFDEWEDKIRALYESECADKIEFNKFEKRYKKKSGSQQFYDSLYNAVSDLDVRDVLSMLYPQFTVRDSGEVFEGDRRTRGYKRNKSGNYMNNFSNDDVDDRPRGGPWSVAHQKFKNYNNMIEFFEKNFGIKVDDIRKELSSTQDISFEVITTDQAVDLIGDGIATERTEKKPKEDPQESTDNKGDGEIVAEKGGDILRIGNKVSGIIIDKKRKEIRGYTADVTDIRLMDALIEPVGKVEVNGDIKYVVKVIKQDGTEMVSLMPICGTNTELRKFLQKFGIMIPDSSILFQHIYIYIFSTNDIYYYTDKMGMQILGGKKVIIDRPGVYIKPEVNVFVHIEDFGKDVITVVDTKVDIKEYVKKLLDGYDGVTSYPIFLGLVMGVNAYFFRHGRLEGELPQGFLFGLSGSGKTTLLERMFYSFGIRKDIAAASKPFVYEKTARHYMPIHFSEFRNSSHRDPDMVQGIFRNMFDGSPFEKGRADQKINRYEANAQYYIDGQTVFTDDATQTRLIMGVANERSQGSLKSLNTLPNIYKYATNVFKDMEDFDKFIQRVREKVDRVNANIKLERMSQRVIRTYAILLSLSDRLGLSEYNSYIVQGLEQQDTLTAQDDIQETYMKAFNLQVFSRFDYYVYKKGIVLNIIEEGTRLSGNIADLRGFVQTINHNFIGANSLPPLSIYIDLDYVYKNGILHGGFLRMINVMHLGMLEPKTDEEKTTLISLKEFLHRKDPKIYGASGIPELNAEINKFTNNKTATGGEIMFD